MLSIFSERSPILTLITVRPNSSCWPKHMIEAHIYFAWQKRQATWLEQSPYWLFRKIMAINPLLTRLTGNSKGIEKFMNFFLKVEDKLLILAEVGIFFDFTESKSSQSGKRTSCHVMLQWSCRNLFPKWTLNSPGSCLDNSVHSHSGAFASLYHTHNVVRQGNKDDFSIYQTQQNRWENR